MSDLFGRCRRRPKTPSPNLSHTVDKPPPPTYYFHIMASDRIQRQIDRLLDEADEAAAQQDWETVRARAQHVLTFDPENREGQAFLSAARRALEGTPPTVGLTTSVEQPAAAVDETQAQDSLAGGVFVGRHREMDDLKAALEDALSGRGRLVVLAGELGIGKTRTAQELGVLAAQRGAQVLWGHCYEDEGAPPYWPWVQAIRSYIRERDPNELRSEMGAGAEHIAEIVSDVRDMLPGLATPPQVEPEQARFRLFDAITTFLKNAAQGKPLMLVLDDLQWADRSSLLILEFLAREIGASRLLLVGTFRDVDLPPEHPLAQSLDALDQERLLQRVILGGHSRSDVARFIEVTAGVTPPEEFVEAVHTQTEGNPLFITEVVRLLMQDGELTADSGATWTVRIPEGVREVIGRRLNRLSQETNEILTIASVSGREFEPSLIAPLVENTSEDRLREVLQEAMAALVIEELPRGRYQFSHALFRETLVEEMSLTRKARIHATIGETLEELYGDDAEPHAAELAHHFREAQTAVGKEKLVRYSLMAGERALASYGYEDALDHFERGLVARDITLSGTEAAFDEENAALLFGLARAKSATGVGHQLSEAFANLSRAFDYYAEAGNVAQAVAAAEFPIAPPPYRIPGVAQLMARALTMVPADSHEAGRLLSRYGAILGAADCDFEGAQQALGRAIAIARREGDVPLEVQTLTYAADVSGQHIHWQESVDNGLRAIELASGAGNPGSELHSRYWTSVSLLHMGELGAARPHASVMRDLAQNRRTPKELAGIGFVPITTLSCLEGDWKAGREHSDRGLEVSPLNPILLSPRGLLEYETGESDQGEVYLERLLEVMRRAGPDQSQASVRASMAITAIA